MRKKKGGAEGRGGGANFEWSDPTTSRDPTSGFLRQSRYSDGRHVTQMLSVKKAVPVATAGHLLHPRGLQASEALLGIVDAQDVLRGRGVEAEPARVVAVPSHVVIDRPWQRLAQHPRRQCGREA